MYKMHHHQRASESEFQKDSHTYVHTRVQYIVRYGRQYLLLDRLNNCKNVYVKLCMYVHVHYRFSLSKLLLCKIASKMLE